MKKFIVLSAIALGLQAGAASAATCANRAHVTGQLEARFGETLYANALSASNNVLEVFASPGLETWSITVFLADRGLSCLAATGKGQRKLEMALSDL